MISKEDVLKAARLAKLHLADADATRYTEQLQNIMGHVAKLSELNTDNIEPTSHAVALETPYRPDVPHDAQVIDQVLAQAPAHEDTFFRVPKVI